MADNLDAQTESVPEGHFRDLLSQERLTGPYTRRRGWEPTEDLRPQATTGALGDFELLEESGPGRHGCGVKARQRKLNRTVALKMICRGPGLRSGHSGFTPSRSRRPARSPRHRALFEIGEDQGRHYFAMAFVEGGSLRKRMKTARCPHAKRPCWSGASPKPWPTPRPQVIHRDQPANVLLDRDGQPKVTDSALPRLVKGDSGLPRTGRSSGTPSYMPPEQAAGQMAARRQTSTPWARSFTAC